MSRTTRQTGPDTANLPMDRETFQRFCDEYFPEAPLRLILSDPQGTAFLCNGVCNCSDNDLKSERRFAIDAALRWGEPVICDRIPGHLLWAVPLMHNASLTGGIVICADEEYLFPDNSETCFNLKSACDILLEMATRFNLCNAALLQQIRNGHFLERRRAEAIHDTKAVNPGDILQIYLEEEPELLRVIRSGRRNEAIAIINRLLVIIYSYANSNLSLIKSLLLEMLSAMNRAAVEAGADPEEVFCRNFNYISRLGAIDGEEELSGWVCGILEEVMVSLSNTTGDERGQMMRQITEILSRRCGEHISRDDVADELHLSPSALTRLLKEQAQCGFSQMLARVRVGQAGKMLSETDLPLIQIAYDCGFTDQSYFTRIFSQHTGMTPKEYRQRYNPTAL